MESGWFGLLLHRTLLQSRQASSSRDRKSTTVTVTASGWQPCRVAALSVEECCLRDVNLSKPGIGSDSSARVGGVGGAKTRANKLADWNGGGFMK